VSRNSPLNNGERVVNLNGIARWNAIRDPHILRGHAGDNNFYIVATDMTSTYDSLNEKYKLNL
jgi:hypothetical protein